MTHQLSRSSYQIKNNNNKIKYMIKQDSRLKTKNMVWQSLKVMKAYNIYPHQMICVCRSLCIHGESFKSSLLFSLGRDFTLSILVWAIFPRSLTQENMLIILHYSIQYFLNFRQKSQSLVLILFEIFSEFTVLFF